MKQFAYTTCKWLFYIWLGWREKAFPSLSGSYQVNAENLNGRNCQRKKLPNIIVQAYSAVSTVSSFPTQSPTKTRAARRCPSPAAPRTRPSSTVRSAPPTGSAPPPRPWPPPPHPAAPPPHQTKAQRRASHGGAPPSRSRRGADRPEVRPSVSTGALLPPQSLWQTEGRGVLSQLQFGPQCS